MLLRRNFLHALASFGAWLALSPDSLSAAEPQIGGRFILSDHTGRIVTDQDFHGKFMLIFFGYTFCPDICPTALGTVAEALARLDGAEADRLTPVFVTVDPERDTAARLREFVGHFHPRLVGLTGNPEMIERMTRTYKVTYRKVPGAQGAAPDEYLIDHSAGLYLMDREGRFRVKFLHGMGPEELARRLREELSR
ncbi:MAG: SCO family protein [Magnetospirillum sp. WYHS-4]